MTVVMSKPNLPIIRDWCQSDAYTAMKNFTGARWAWEFLRRNCDYQREWFAFDTVWRQLEAAYGRPPDRDFCAWKADPRAWVHADDCPEGDCRIDGEKVLIECALGARWGFYKFPPDPRDDDPVGDDRLAWREVASPVRQLGAADAAWCESSSHLALGFDLSLPLREQMEQAKRTLQAEQRRRQRAGLVAPVSARARAADWVVMLRLLDAEAGNASASELTSISPGWEGSLQEAHRLCEGGYRQLALLPP